MLYNKILSILFLLAFLYACNIAGYRVRPLYGNHVNREIEKVYIATLPGEYGVYLRNILRRNILLHGTPLYRLEIKYTWKEQELAISKDGSSARKRINLQLECRLVPLDGKNKQLTAFTTDGLANFSTQKSGYAIEMARSFAIKRAMNMAAQSAIMFLYAFFATENAH